AFELGRLRFFRGGHFAEAELFDDALPNHGIREHLPHGREAFEVDVPFVLFGRVAAGTILLHEWPDASAEFGLKRGGARWFRESLGAGQQGKSYKLRNVATEATHTVFLHPSNV